MNQKEIYKKLFEYWVELVNLKMGDCVRIIRIPNDFEMGWNNIACPVMARMCRKVFIVDDVRYGNVIIRFEGSSISFPFFVLEKVDTHIISVDGTQMQINDEKYREIMKLLD